MKGLIYIPSFNLSIIFLFSIKIEFDYDKPKSNHNLNKIIPKDLIKQKQIEEIFISFQFKKEGKNKFYLYDDDKIYNFTINGLPYIKKVKIRSFR
ncbi:SNF2 helicase associated domain-containing protein [Caldicellulosiruptoraceae bacterium PP1]